MIEIKNVTKIFYDKKRKTKVKALNKVSFNLPEKGLVFINGKSGSGKSTLLNLVGGLASPTSGRILFNKNNITRFTSQKYNRYRSGYIGFVFQDYHLLDELNVEENINFFAYKGSGSFTLEEILDLTYLNGLEQRHINELSGGQKQRVAIARAVMKNPKLLLCDEPTGNLDENTSLQILKVLKEISKRILVVIVSHSVKDSEIFGDRIITLDEGNVVSDISKAEKNTPLIQDGILTLPYRKNLDEDDIELINKSFKNKEISQIKASSSGFSNTNDKEIHSKKEKVRGRGIDKMTFLKLYNKFVNRKKFASIIEIVVSTLLIVVFSFCSSLSTFDINKAMENDFRKKDEEYATFYRIHNNGYPIIEPYIKDDVKKLGYTDMISEVIYYPIPLTKTYATSSLDLFTGVSYTYLLGKQHYLKNTGYLITINEKNLTKLYGIDGNLNVLAGDINDQTGVIITDLAADSLMYYNPEQFKTYDDVLGFRTYTNDMVKGKVVAVIDTPYEEKYKDLIEFAAQEGNIITTHKDFKAYSSDLTQFLGATYSLNPNIGEVLSSIEYTTAAYLHTFLIDGGTGFTNVLTPTQYCYKYLSDKNNLNPGEIILSAAFYNATFGTAYDKTNLDTFEPHKITLARTIGNYLDEEILFSKELTVVGLSLNSYFSLHPDDMEEINSINYRGVRHILFDISKIGVAAKHYINRNFYKLGETYFSQTIKYLDTIIIFSRLFLLLALILLAVIVFYIVSFAVKYIKENRYQIGILKAMGASTFQLCGVFVLRTMLVGLATVILGALSVYFLNPLFNDLLREAGYTLLRTTFTIDTIIISPLDIFVLSGFILLIVLVASMMPILALHKVKPIDILRERE